MKGQKKETPRVEAMEKISRSTERAAIAPAAAQIEGRGGFEMNGEEATLRGEGMRKGRFFKEEECVGVPLIQLLRILHRRVEERVH